MNSCNNVFICIFNKKIDFELTKLFLLHISICYKNLYLKLSKSLEDNKNIFGSIFTEIFLIPIMHNFDKAYEHLKKKIDLILFGNSEYISSMIVDLESNEIIYDIGKLIQKKYKSAFLSFQKKKDILEEIRFHGINLKNSYIKSNDKNLDKIENSLKLELRATFPKPLFMIKFFPVLKGITIVHYFYQYKLSKSQKRNPNNPNEFIYDNYKELDIGYFNLFNNLDENNLDQIKIIEKFFFEYFIILGNNAKEAGNIQNRLMTYKSRDNNLIYINIDILLLIKNIIMEYFKDEKDLLNKLRKKLFEEYEKYENLNQQTLITKTEPINTNNNYNIISNEYLNNKDDNKQQPLEFSYADFLKEFKSNLLLNKKDNKLISLNDVNVTFKEDFSNVNEYTELNLTKNNIGLLKRNIVTSSVENNEFNIYNNYGIITTDTKNLQTEVDNEGVPIGTNEPFNIDVTNIAKNVEPSKDEWGFKSILAKK